MRGRQEWNGRIPAVPARVAWGLATAWTLLAAPASADAQAADSLPFASGERLTFSARVEKVGTIGRGEMTVEGPVEVRGVTTYKLRFSIDTRVGPVNVVNRSESWLDVTRGPARVTALRFHKHERQPFSRHDERVEMYPDQRRWQGAAGTAGESPTDAPLDELSFLYFLRTLPLDADTAVRFDRHFEAGRNPTIVRVLGRETVTTPAGEFRTVRVEMRVRDARHYKGEGVIRLNLTDDHCRLPVRIESRMPVVGTVVLTLESYTRGVAHAPAPVIARAP
jgi:hypothetical protein